MFEIAHLSAKIGRVREPIGDFGSSTLSPRSPCGWGFLKGQASLPTGRGGGGIDEMRPRCLTRPEPRGSAIKKRTVATPLAPGQDTQIHRSMNQHHRKQEQVLWLCVSPERNTDPLRSDHPSRANGVDLCFAETKHRSRDASHPDLSKPSER